MTKQGADLSDGWSIAADAAEVHELLCASDVFVAATYGTPVPRRNRESTDGLVSAGAVHLLRQGGVATGMFTLTWAPSFTTGTDIFPDTAKPIYMQRMAVLPDRVTGGELTGLMCVRRAMEAALEYGATAIRAETNPDLTNTLLLIEQFGFRPYGPVLADGGVRRIHLQNDLEIPE
ncbi:hypothetical protein [Streptomyces sp. SCSIO ZS0520]|uniref:hypothetical protein n=1 Tax=Streptomyces sp. SCSIO ZS0520 TaxID=2892996 RepID=UPI0021D8F898|nr:hypothetical protein [Streptomyces sp. SCSIO ZS0520]